MYTNFLPATNWLWVCSNTFQSSLNMQTATITEQSKLILWKVGNQHLCYLIISPLYHLAFVLLCRHERTLIHGNITAISSYEHTSAIVHLSHKIAVNSTLPIFQKTELLLTSLFKNITSICLKIWTVNCLSES